MGATPVPIPLNEASAELIFSRFDLAFPQKV